jgi:hypothetical protein
MKLTVEVAANELPMAVADKLPGGKPLRGARYRITVEEVIDDGAKLAALRADIAEGLADIDAGRVEAFDVDGFLAEIHAEADARN